MSKNFLDNDLLPQFLETLSVFGEIHGPAFTGDAVLSFRKIDSPADLLLDYHRTLIPPKKYLLRPFETILSYEPGKGYTEADASVAKLILFALHPCDLAGIAYLDRVFMDGEPDPLYAARRKAITLVGISCKEDDYCFCDRYGDTLPAPFDLFLEKTGSGYFINSGSAKGMALVQKLDQLLSERRAAEREVDGYEGARPPGLEALAESPLWDEFSRRCLSCGACSLCCPTCYCFDVREYGGLDGRSASRVREWDNCLFKAHGEVAGGNNFRAARAERFRYRYMHKYHGFGSMSGMASCVGCGRCREVCPVKIDLTQLFGEEGHGNHS